MRNQQRGIRLLAACFVGAVAWSANTAATADKDKDDRPAVVNTLGMKLVLVRKGDFQMGSEEFPSEKPPRPARVTQDFYLAIHHVTVGQFRSFVKDTGYKTEADRKSVV